METAASLDVMRVRKLLEHHQHEEALRLVSEIVAMLTALIKAT
jgi:hypothetical protein